MGVIGRLIRSGWWVALAGVAVALAIVLLALTAPSSDEGTRLGDGRDPSSYGFDLSNAMIPAAKIVASGLPRDGLVALLDPDFLTADDVADLNQEGRGKFLLPTDRVVAVEINGDARVYPLRFMRWHEVVNDTVGDRPIAVTYSPLCDSAVVTSRMVDGTALEFGVSGLVFNSNPLLFDRQDDPEASSLWTQLDGRVVAGPAASSGEHLEVLPSSLTTWGHWSDRHPTSRVLAPLTRLKRVYKRDPYHSYFGSDVLRFPVEPLPPAADLRLKDRVLILTVDEADTVFSLTRIAEHTGTAAGSWSADIAGLAVAIHYDSVRGTASVEWPDIGDKRVASRQAFWFAWYSQHPNTPPPLP